MTEDRGANTTPKPGTSSKLVPSSKWIPVKAEDVAAERRRKLLMISGAVVLVLLLVWFIYRRSVTPIEGQQAQDAGARLYKSASYQQSILNFNRAIELNPSATEAYRMRARAFFAEHDWDGAIRDYTKVTELAPRDANSFIERGLIYLEKKDFAGAVRDANKALEIDPKLARAYNLRATAIRALGDPAKALADFTRAVELDANLDNLFQRAATYQQLNNHQAALADLNAALEIAPDQPHAYFARARSKLALGDTAGAKSDYQIGRKIDGW